MIAVWASPGPSAAAPKRVVILDSFGRDIAPFKIAASAFRSAIPRGLGEVVDLYQMSPELAWSVPSEGDDPLVEALMRRFEVLPADLVVPIGAPAVRFATRYRERIFPETPLVLTGADPRLTESESVAPETVVVSQRISLTGVIEDIELPSTRKIVVIFGGSATR